LKPVNKVNLKWSLLSINSNDKIVDLLFQNLDKINMNNFNINSNKKVVKFIKENNCIINWIILSKNTNPDILEILKENYCDINWTSISINPNIFQLDYEKMIFNEKYQEFEEELIKEILKPSRVFKERDYDYLELLFE